MADIFRGRIVVVLIFPRGEFIVHIDDISVHFRKRFVVADDPLRLNSAEHFTVTVQKEFLLIRMVTMFTHHIGGHRYCAALGDALEAKFKGAFVASTGGDDPDAFAGEIRAAPAVAEYIIKLHGGSHLPI